jgi:hypothetical protein
MAIPSFFPSIDPNLGVFSPKIPSKKSQLVFSGRQVAKFGPGKKFCMYIKIDVCLTRYRHPRIQPCPFPSQSLVHSQARAL